MGKIADSATGYTLSNATVELMRVKDSVVVRKTISQRGFSFSKLPAGDYQLLFTYIGYRDTSYLILLKETDTLVNTGVIRMRKSSGDLMEVVIRAVIPPVIVKSDTVVYNTEAFKTKPNATVAELLKLLPGMEVDKDGTVTFQGQKVQKIYIDGKEFFLNDPRLATQNLLADMVQKVEAFDTKSERARLTGIPDDNPGKSINLRLKPNKKKGLTGTFEAGYGSQDRYGMKATATQFNGDAMTMAVINSSNGGDVQQGAPGLLNNRQNNITLNYRNNFSKKLQLTGDYNFNSNNTKNAFSSSRETFFSDSSLLQDKRSASANQNYNHRFGTAINWTIDTSNIINANISLGISQNNYSSAEGTVTDTKKNTAVHHLNNASTENQNTSDGFNAGFSIGYSHVFKKKGRYLGLSLSNGINNNNGLGDMHSLTRFFDSNGVQNDSLERNQRSNSDGLGNNIGFGINYTEPIGKNKVLDFGWSINRGTSNSDRHTYNYNPFTGKYDNRDTLASNAFENTNISQQFSLGYNYFKSKLNYQLGISVSKNSQENIIKEGIGDDIRQNMFNIYPRASMLYSISREKNLQIRYSGSTRQPSIYQLQPVPDYSNPLLIRLGNPTLKQEFGNEISFSYNNFKKTTARSFTWSGELRNTTNMIVNSTITDAQGVQTQRHVNVQGNYNIGSSMNYGLPLGKNRKYGGINSSTRIRHGQEISLANGEENKKRSLQLSQSISLNYHKADKIFAGLQAGIDWNRSTYSIQSFSITNFLSQRYSCSLSYEFLKNFVISSDLAMSFTNTQGTLTGQSSKVWNAAAMKRLFKNKAELRFSVFDVLNDNNSFSQYTGDNYIETSEQQVMKRVFVLSFMYRFSRMGS